MTETLNPKLVLVWHAAQGVTPYDKMCRQSCRMPGEAANFGVCHTCGWARFASRIARSAMAGLAVQQRQFVKCLSAAAGKAVVIRMLLFRAVLCCSVLPQE